MFASTNPQYDDRLFIELQVQYTKIPSSNLGRTFCVQKLFLTVRTIFVHNMFSPCSAKRRASDKDLPVLLHDDLSEFKVISSYFIPTNSNFADTKAIFDYFMEMFKKEGFVVCSKCLDYFEVHTKKYEFF